MLAISENLLIVILLARYILIWVLIDVKLLLAKTNANDNLVFHKIAFSSYGFSKLLETFNGPHYIVTCIVPLVCRTEWFCHCWHSNNFFYSLSIMSQVEHARKHNSIHSENKYVKQNSDCQNHSTVHFYTLLYNCYTVKIFLAWTE